MATGLSVTNRQVHLVVWQEGSHHLAVDARGIGGLQSCTGQNVAADACIAGLLPGLPRQPLYRISWQQQGRTCTLDIGSEPHHLMLPAHALWPLPPTLLHARRTPALQALAWYRDRPLLILDKRVLCR